MSKRGRIVRTINQDGVLLIVYTSPISDMPFLKSMADATNRLRRLLPLCILNLHLWG